MPYLDVNLTLSGTIRIVGATKFAITRKEPNMPNLTTIAPGSSGTFVAQFLDNGSPETLPAGVTTTWSLSDPTVGTIEPLSSDPTGLTAVVTVSAAAALNESFNVMITSSTLPDGSVATGELAQTVAVAQVFTFSVTRTS